MGKAQELAYEGNGAILLQLLLAYLLCLPTSTSSREAHPYGVGGVVGRGLFRTVPVHQGRKKQEGVLYIDVCLERPPLLHLCKS